jgi:hypothetical protein
MYAWLKTCFVTPTYKFDLIFQNVSFLLLKDIEEYLAISLFILYYILNANI